MKVLRCENCLARWVNRWQARFIGRVHPVGYIVSESHCCDDPDPQWREEE